MSVPSRTARQLSPTVLATQLGLIVLACVVVVTLPYLFTKEETEIRAYSAPKEPPRKMSAEPPSKGEPARLWGAIVPLQNELWFFKLTGPVEEVGQLEPQLREFLQTVRFDKGDPKWTTPEGWTMRPGNEFRFATLLIPSSQKPLELAVSKLPRGDDPLAEQLLANVNRWRGQVTQPPLNSDELESAAETIQIDGRSSILVSLVGIAAPSSMGRGPFMK